MDQFQVIAQDQDIPPHTHTYTRKHHASHRVNPLRHLLYL